MDWIKKNYDRFLLAVSVLVLICVAVLLLLQANAFKSTYVGQSQMLVRSGKIEAVEMGQIEEASRSLSKPAVWKPRGSSLFVSNRYLVKDGKLVNPLEEDGLPIHPPVPNKWFEQNGLDLLDPNILQADSDNDGFTNFEEFGAKTDPLNKDSHPLLVSKLRLKQFVKNPFRMVFKSYYGEPDKTESLSFQINPLDYRLPSQLLRMNDSVAEQFKIIKFEKKVSLDASGIEQDLSELTLQNESGEIVVLPLNKVVNSPRTFGIFKFLADGSEFRVQRGQEFSCGTESVKKYKLIDINPTEALIQSVDGGQSMTVPRLEVTTQ